MSDYDSGQIWLGPDPMEESSPLPVMAEVERLKVALADCQQLAKGEQSLLDSLETQAAELRALQDALALTAVELAEVRKERDRAVERLERAGLI